VADFRQGPRRGQQSTACVTERARAIFVFTGRIRLDDVHVEVSTLRRRRRMAYRGLTLTSTIFGLRLAAADGTTSLITAEGLSPGDFVDVLYDRWTRAQRPAEIAVTVESR
jgi:hypothetical protein